MTINLNLGCSLEAMKTMKDNSYDLAVVDPPYGINADKKNNGPNSDTHARTSAAKLNTYTLKNWDKNIPSLEYFMELKRVSKRQIVWGVNYYPYEILKGGRLFWNKKVTMPTYSKGEIAYVSHIKSVQYFEYTWHGMLQENMKNKEKRIHPTQKPVALYHWIFDMYATAGMKILDTHLGSGSSAIAAHDCGLDFDGWEIDTEYYTAAVSRYNEHTRQMKLFT